MFDTISAYRLIKQAMPVVCSEHGQFAVVDHLEGSDTIKLAKDGSGLHHYIPLTWVTAVDDKVHIDRSGDQAMQEWSTARVAFERPMTQPIVARVKARKLELEQALAALPEDQLRERGDLGLALSTIDALLTGDLAHVPAVVCADMSRWLERNKHLVTTPIATEPAEPDGPSDGN
jgi:hypothetical protein